MPSRFNSPPGWPKPPEGWQPPPEWRPDATWPPAPAGWQFWLDDGFPAFASQPAPLLGEGAPVGSGSTGQVSRWLGWSGLVAIALLGLLSSGVSSALVMAGVYVAVVGIVALARGQVGWARLGSRTGGVLVTGGGFLVLLVGAVIAPATTASAPPTLTAAALASTTAGHVVTADPAATGPAGEPADPTSAPARTTAAGAATTRAKVASRPVAHPKPAAAKPKPKPKPKQTNTRQSPPKPQPEPTAPSCSPLTNGGNCYEPGEFCRASDHGVSGIAGDGKRIVCRDNDGWRWEPA